jgi:hypothetical protein
MNIIPLILSIICLALVVLGWAMCDKSKYSIRLPDSVLWKNALTDPCWWLSLVGTVGLAVIIFNAAGLLW